MALSGPSQPPLMTFFLVWWWRFASCLHQMLTFSLYSCKQGYLVGVVSSFLFFIWSLVVYPSCTNSSSIQLCKCRTQLLIDISTAQYCSPESHRGGGPACFWHISVAQLQLRIRSQARNLKKFQWGAQLEVMTVEKESIHEDNVATLGKRWCMSTFKA